jgi:H+-translocating NAD(P) transhydrogenase subunit beta
VTDLVTPRRICRCWKAKQVFVPKREQSTEYSGIQNPLFFKDSTRTYYGDAKKSLDELLTKIS